MKKVPRFLLSEALRTEGAHLRNFEMNQFMGKYHPMGEQAPRDLVARAILHEMEVSRAKDPFVYLDLTHLNAKKVEKRFPRTYAACMQHNIDITEDMIPVRPAAHFSVGGVRTDLDGKTTVEDSMPRARPATGAWSQPATQQLASRRHCLWRPRWQSDARRREGGFA
jgi:L-aspartate oxidase